MGHETYHEPLELLSEDTKNLHRALVSLIEELEAIDWYQQRQEACSDDELRRTISHNRDEEIEHACMTLEWIRRHSAQFDRQLRTYVFTSGPITEAEKRAQGAEADAVGGAPSGDLGVDSLRGKV